MIFTAIGTAIAGALGASVFLGSAITPVLGSSISIYDATDGG